MSQFFVHLDIFGKFWQKFLGLELRKVAKSCHVMMPLAKWLKRHKLLMMLVELVVERSSLERIIFKARSEWITELPGSAD